MPASFDCSSRLFAVILKGNWSFRVCNWLYGDRSCEGAGAVMTKLTEEQRKYLDEWLAENQTRTNGAMIEALEEMGHLSKGMVDAGATGLAKLRQQLHGVAINSRAVLATPSGRRFTNGWTACLNGPGRPPRTRSHATFLTTRKSTSISRWTGRCRKNISKPGHKDEMV